MARHGMGDAPAFARAREISADRPSAVSLMEKG
jgi:hypothetical protein